VLASARGLCYTRCRALRVVETGKRLDSPNRTQPDRTGAFQPQAGPTEAHPTQVKFVHYIEEVFARILDYYGVRWEYEPRTFPLQWDENGHVIVAFTPDFYLPDEDQYIELTTLRPKLMRQKNAKLRRMRELYPDVKIKLLRRRDLRDMMLRFGMDEEAERIFSTEAQNTERLNDSEEE
jgi:hypothetical protein